MLFPLGEGLISRDMNSRRMHDDRLYFAICVRLVEMHDIAALKKLVLLLFPWGCPKDGRKHNPITSVVLEGVSRTRDVANTR